MAVEAVIFDFDGLIRDTETYEFYSFQELLMEYGVELPLELYSSRIGGHFNSFDPYEFLQQSIGKTLDRELLRKLRREKYDKLIVNQKALPGVQNYLNEAKGLGINIGLASSAPRNWVVPNLEELGLTDYFSCIRTHEDAKNVKPAPDLYLQVLDYFGVKPINAVAFEDSPNGAKAAKAAGMYCIIVPNKLTRELFFEAYDLRLNSLEDMNLTTAIRLLTKSH
ncbi:HAD-IA family hydrolase [Paenibacillus sp. JDR-2]|uniref:HAD-IA family hydrolase n=1 Tax=Paenibacillus sp. (strain JDR-2) TaxID=324057 RepID=UPI0001664A15|nr:HAD-IA family hydrolase [Paenibacillus sp. JDR-2]ACT03522.1 HAD-superfamily hydrolase, subfamily IA, variant 3 [Paenibacillus sp. JDR-2]